MIKRIAMFTFAIGLLVGGFVVVPRKAAAEVYFNESMTFGVMPKVTVTCTYDVANRGISTGADGAGWGSSVTTKGCKYNNGTAANNAYDLLHAAQLTKPGLPDFSTFPSVVKYWGYGDGRNINDISGSGAWDYREGNTKTLVAMCDYNDVCSFPRLYN